MTGLISGFTQAIYVFDDAPHGLHAGERPSDRKADADAGWQEMLQWFAKHLA